MYEFVRHVQYNQIKATQLAIGLLPDTLQLRLRQDRYKSPSINVAGDVMDHSRSRSDSIWMQLCVAVPDKRRFVLDNCLCSLQDGRCIVKLKTINP